MLKIAVNNIPVVPCGARNPKGPTTASSTVEGLLFGGAQVDPDIKTPPAQFARMTEPVGIMLPIRSAPQGLSLDRSLELSVMSNPLNGSVLLIMTGTLSREFGVVNGPLNVGPVGNGHFVSVTCAIQTRPLPAAWARGITCAGSIAPRIASGRRIVRTDNFLFKSGSSAHFRFIVRCYCLLPRVLFNLAFGSAIIF